MTQANMTVFFIRFQGMTQANMTEFKIFGVMQHSHLAGVRITTRHFRGGRELPPIITDPNYDFNFQELRKLPQEIAVHPVCIPIGFIALKCDYSLQSNEHKKCMQLIFPMTFIFDYDV